MKPTIVMRAHNDRPLIEKTLCMLAVQDHPHDLVVLDNDSTDGTQEIVRARASRVVTIPRGQYVAGRVINLGMEASEGEIVVFLNSDCTPLDPTWLSRLLAGFTSENVAAVFGRQVPRPGCHFLHAADVESAYGDGARQARWRHAFSMASSAIRRSVWQKMPFNSALRYSEDIDWTWRARQAGHEIRYVPGSVVYHSHNYTYRQLYRRHRGEGEAEAQVFDWTPWQRSWTRYVALPWARQVLSDWKLCLRKRNLAPALESPLLRLVQQLGRRAGFNAGWKARAAEPTPVKEARSCQPAV